MADSACNGMQIKVINSNVTYTDGEAAPIVIAAAAPSAGGSGGVLTDASGNSPPKVPIKVDNNTTYILTAASSDGSGGWARGALTIQCMYGTSASNPGTAEVLTVNYSGEPSAFPSHASNCTCSCSSLVKSAHFTVQGSGSQGQGSACGVTFTVMNGGTASASASAAEPAETV